MDFVETAHGPDVFELTKRQAQHVYDVMRDGLADGASCAECEPIIEELRRWLSR